MRLLPKSIHRCRRYPTKFNSGRDIPYRSHGFVSKGDACPLGAADLLAWEWAKYYDETVTRKKRPMRLSFQALVRDRLDCYSGSHLEGETFAQFLASVREFGVEQLKDKALMKSVKHVPFE